GSRLSVFRKDADIQQPTGTFENVIVKNVKAKAADSAQLKPPSGILITGVPGHYITNLTLENIEIDLSGTGTLADSRHTVPEAVDQYPEVKTFGPTIPAYGVWARHVQGLKLKNITFRLKNNDVRPAIICEDGRNIEIMQCRIPETDGAESIIRLQDVKGAVIGQNKVHGKAGAFVLKEGKSTDVILKNNKTGKVK
ncbi:MAG: glycoside hydrolase family 28 protein, partial [Ginsengibacter sp.]